MKLSVNDPTQNASPPSPNHPMGPHPQVSGLTCWLGSKLLGLQSLPPVSIALLITILVAMVTEVLSNTATATLFLPVVASLVSHE